MSQHDSDSLPGIGSWSTIALPLRRIRTKVPHKDLRLGLYCLHNVAERDIVARMRHRLSTVGIQNEQESCSQIRSCSYAPQRRLS